MSTAAPSPAATIVIERETRPLYAIFLRLAAAAALSAMFALIKYLSDRGVNLVEMIFYRQFFAIPVIYAWIAIKRGPLGFRTSRIGAHATRTIIGLTGMIFNFTGVAMLPLAESTTIGFTAPIFATILSALVLREATGIHRWTAVAVGFVGVLIIAGPNAAHFPSLGVLISLTAAVFVAFVAIVLRELSKTEDIAVIAFWFSVLSAVPIALLMVHYGEGHDLGTFALIFAMGTIGGIAQLLMTNALRWGPVSIVLPMDYSAILWATLFGWLVWGKLPVAATLAGAVMIIGSGLYIAAREHRLGRDEALKAKAEADMRN
jgi:drug/metabolite transporter (DMT)-like permease